MSDLAGFHVRHVFRDGAASRRDCGGSVPNRVGGGLVHSAEVDAVRRGEVGAHLDYRVLGDDSCYPGLGEYRGGSEGGGALCDEEGSLLGGALLWGGVCPAGSVDWEDLLQGLWRD